MIESGAKIDTLDKKKQTALHHALRHSRFNTAKILIECGADINARGEYGKTPLNIISTSDDNIEMVELLLNNDADPNIQDDEIKHHYIMLLFMDVLK